MACDVTAIVSLFCDNGVMMPPNETSLYGREELQEWHDEYFRDFKVVTLSDTEREVSMLGEWAVERWAYMVAIVPLKGGERIRDDGRFLILWHREPDGVWRISQAIFNSIRPVGAGTSRFLARVMQAKKKG